MVFYYIFFLEYFYLGVLVLDNKKEQNLNREEDYNNFDYMVVNN